MNATIVSVGGGGYDVANKVRQSGLFAGAAFLSCDTDKTALKEYTNADKHFLFVKCYEKEETNVKELLEHTGNTIILCATLGGLTGSTCAPIVAGEAQRVGKFVCSLFTMPFEFEGEKRNQRAETALPKLVSDSNFSIQQNNDSLRKVRNGKCTLYDFMEDQSLIEKLKLMLDRIEICQERWMLKRTGLA